MSRFLLLIVLIVSLQSFWLPSMTLAENVFILMSYAKDDPCGGPQYRGSIAALKSEGFSEAKITSYFLNSRTIDKKGLQKRIQGARRMCRDVRPDVAIAIDDIAFQVLAPDYIDDSGKGYLVFSGLNITPEEYNKRFLFHVDRMPVKRITGVYEKLFIQKQLKFFSLLMGKGLGRVVLLYSDDPVGHIVKNQIIREIKGSAYEHIVDPVKVSTIDDLMSAACALQSDPNVSAYFPIVLSVKGRVPGKTLTMREIAPLLASMIRKPDLTINSSFVDLGLWGGVSIDFYHMGYEAGELAALLLKGYEIRKIKMKDAEKAMIVINLNRNRELGIKLPPVIMGMVDRFVQ